MNATDDRLEVVDVEDPGIEISVPSNDIERMVIEHQLVDRIVLFHENTKVALLVVRLELDWAPMVGALIVTRGVWDAMSPAGRHALREAGSAAGAELRALSRREHEESVAAMKKRGLKVQAVTPEVEAEWRRAAEQMYPLVRGSMVPADFFDEVQRLLREYRSKS